ncbi:hypothetical protein Pmar_PMAR007238 [Perkinsus marinus ATCC 50983]|uniref:Uncharacterized protein n=1 Tax=Perkinsus marinus (strain ATCC 50983 / TXsc) TaxID=423536 RepID=C5LWR4_PERM5|nr:hypothetical protein Pmar_PMAR007238 [Perkinsus marinus ATCC 50983]EEQ98859.1 hypothetical protein Pmar_PMAR007238 [Perkinsus marinus ATCC 50983]|eukprot:XP_002766142.1 hypothetical protein Pmar_PMAR007238 [Perkinsus marinus ATCC 50983]
MPTTYTGTTPQQYFSSRPSSSSTAAGRTTGSKEEQIQRLKQLLEMMKSLPKGDVTNEDGDKIVDIEEKLDDTKAPASKAPQVASVSSSSSAAVEEKEIEIKRKEMVKWWAAVMEETPSYNEPDYDERELHQGAEAMPTTSNTTDRVPETTTTTDAFTGTVAEHGENKVEKNEDAPKRMSKFKMDRAAKKGFGGMFAARHGIPMGGGQNSQPGE